tara:strand:- start:17952 stop:18491 length:540 start_codon:yes stop_codon:yes gene_type:complete
MKPIIYVTVALYSLLGSVSAEHSHEEHDIEFSAQHAHEHGKVLATISHSNNQLNLHLVLPAFNVFGFEHGPRNKEEQSLVDRILKMLSQPGNVIKLQPDCDPTAINTINSQENNSGTTDKHYDVELEYMFSCPSSDSTIITFSLFHSLPGIDQIEVQYVSDTKQRLITLDNDNYIMTID